MRALSIFAFVVLAGLAPANADTVVDVELVLAVDGSASVDPAEFRLQLDGIAAAFRDAAVHRAIAAGKEQRIGVSLLTWADATRPKDASPWYVIDSPAAAEAFAQLVESFPRRVVGGTGIGAGLSTAVRMLGVNDLTGHRRVVDVSGDGIETPPREIVMVLPDARAMALANDVVVNGLAILSDVPDLDDWYRRNLQIGGGSFVMAAKQFSDFATAFRRKLLREIDATPKISWVR
jgi:hypothetical protein